MGRRGFSLLEVMVAIAILALSLTVILSAQGGLAASNRSAANLGVATNLARCKMTELEEKLLKNGYPEIDQIDTEVSCCDDADRDGFKCDTKVEKVELPNPPQNSLGDGGALLGAAGAASGSAGPDPLAALAAGGLDGGVAGLQGIAKQLGPLGGGSEGAGVQGLLTTVMGIVYPSIKPLMEASIRKITVTVRWTEGLKKRDLPILQYVTAPQRGGFISGVVGIDGGAAGPAAPGGPASPVPPSGPPAGGGLGTGRGVNP